MRKLERWKGRNRVRGFGAVFAVGAMLCLTACGPAPSPGQQESNAQLKQNAEHATEQAKHDAHVAARDAHHAAVDAAHKVGAIESGVREGLGKPAPGEASGVVDINSASQSKLETLPGVGESTARRIISERPYAEREDLVRKGAVSKAEYGRIADRISTH